MCTERRHPQRGFTLIELIIFIVVVSVGLVGILSALNVTAMHSSDPVYAKQALAIAEALMDEIQLKDFSDPGSGLVPGVRGDYDDVDDFDGYASSGVHAIDDPLANSADRAFAIVSVNRYDISVAICHPGAAGCPLAAAPTGIAAAADVWFITIQVTDPGGTVHTFTGYRLNYD